VRTIAVVLLLVGLAGVAAAHPLAPSSLQIEEEAPGVATARFQAPVAARLAPRWPAGCTATPLARTIADGIRVDEVALDCGGRGLAGGELGVDGLGARDTIALVRIRLAGGAVVREVLGPSRPRVTIPAETPWTEAGARYLRLGIDHLVGGLDHVLFVLGLLFLVSGLRARLVTLTAFTAGHSLTLALAVLGLVRVPAAPVELLIALTLIVVAHEVVEPRRDGRGRSWLLAAGFGLIHGLGFAGALTGAGLPADELPLALVGFNLGIELGQLGLVAAAMLIVALAAPLVERAPRLAPRTRRIAGYAIGGLAAMWCLERALTLV
jgi:hydrogenase/urease accessory protein HupE